MKATLKDIATTLTGSRVLLGLIVGTEFAALGAYELRKKNMLARATARAAAIGRPLVHFGFTGRASLGVDTMQKDWAVVYAEGLEYADDAPEAYEAMLAVAGDPGNVFIASLPSWSLTSALWPGTRWVINRAPPDGGVFLADPTGGMSQRFLAMGVAATALDALRNK